MAVFGATWWTVHGGEHGIARSAGELDDARWDAVDITVVIHEPCVDVGVNRRPPRVP